MKTKSIIVGLLLCAAVLTAMGQSNLLPVLTTTETPAEPAGPAKVILDAAKPLLELLGGKGTLLTTVVAWVAAISLFLAPFSVWISHGLRNAINRVAASSAVDDDEYLRRLFSKKWYSFAAFLLRFINVDLPVLADLERALELQREAANKTTTP